MEVVYDLASRVGLKSIALRARLTEADALHAVGDTDRARIAAESVKNEATIIGALDIERRADEKMQGRTLFSSLAELEQVMASDPDDDLLALSDTEVDDASDEIANSLGIQAENLPNSRKDLRWQVLDAKERRDWCASLTGIQSKRHRCNDPDAEISWVGT